jgi:hypothetical protein
MQFARSVIAGIAAMVAMGSAAYGAEEGLLLYFPMEEGQGNVLKDASGQGRDGKIVGSGKWVNGKYGRGLQVAAADEVQIADDGSLDGMGELTAELWVWMEAHHNTGLIQKGANWPEISYLIQPWGDGQIYFGIKETSSRAITKAGDFPLGAWYHLAAVFDGKQLRLYINGDKKAEAPPPAGVKAVHDTPNPIQLGNRFNGVMDEFVLYKRALTQEEIRKNMAGTVLAVNPAGKAAVRWAALKARGKADMR